MVLRVSFFVSVEWFKDDEQHRSFSLAYSQKTSLYHVKSMCEVDFFR